MTKVLYSNPWPVRVVILNLSTIRRISGISFPTKINIIQRNVSPKFLSGLIPAVDKQGQRENANDNREKSDNGSVVSIQPMPSAADMPTDRDEEQGRTFIKGLVLIVLLWFVYAFLHRL